MQYDNTSTKGVETLLIVLVIVNAFSSGQMSQVVAFLQTAGSNDTKGTQIHQAFLVLGGELLFMVILIIIAQSSPRANDIVFSMVVVLWIAWFFHNKPVLDALVAKVIPAQPVVKQGGNLTKA